MKTITIRDLRLRWPATERTLQDEHELIITRDGQPVARLLRVAKTPLKRKRWDPEKHKQWLRKLWGHTAFPSADAALARDRADRWEKDAG